MLYRKKNKISLFEKSCLLKNFDTDRIIFQSSYIPPGMIGIVKLEKEESLTELKKNPIILFKD